MSKTAVILFNLGGPDSPEAVKPFLYNLFSDPAILQVPAILRRPLAWIISRKAAARARGNYQKIGGKSPLLENTQAQAEMLEKMLGSDYKVFVCMRYWHPMSDMVAKNVKAWQPDRILLLPLYPQFSTTTTGSSYADWNRAASGAGITAPTTLLCCYPNDKNLVAAHAKLIKDAYWKASESGKPRILFSAHGLPQKIINEGDPYSWQVKETTSAVLKILAIENVDHVICYQSRVGKLQWTTPYTDEEIRRAGQGGVPVVIAPIAFVSEHSETLVELDMEYRELAHEAGVPSYQRVPALGTEPFFIECLADLCRNAGKEEGITSFEKRRLCPRNFEKCLCEG